MSGLLNFNIHIRQAGVKLKLNKYISKFLKSKQMIKFKSDIKLA